MKMEIQRIKKLMIGTFVDGFVCSAGIGALVDYVRTMDSIQFVFGITLLVSGLFCLYLNFDKINGNEEK